MFSFFEKILYSFRNILWNYPDTLFLEENALFRVAYKAYASLRPFSHILFFLIIFILVIAVSTSGVKGFIKINNNIYREGVIVGTDENGDLQKLARLNPLVNTNVQLEKDLNELIYEGLIKVGPNGEVTAVLADFIVLKEGESYQFKLKDGLKWQDGVPITSKDVESTFSLIQELDKEPRTSTVFSRAASKMELTVLDERSFKMDLKSVIPAFFESISFKILPSHLISDLNPDNITESDPLINRKPIGTGPFRLAKYEDNVVKLVRNEYYRTPIGLTEIQFRLFPDEQSMLDALRSGQVHAISDISYDNLRIIQNENIFKVYNSNVLYNQYWSIYFNLGENGPAPLKEKLVRQAISSAINRKIIIEALLGYGEEAKGPIPPTSFAYTEQTTYGFDKAKSVKLLESAGWKLNADGVRAKNDQTLSLELLVVNNSDRIKIAEVIQKDLDDVGIKIKIVKKDLITMINEHIQTKQFQVLLYGVQTFSDPDRYELFHSSQIAHPGLNISSYISAEQVLSVVGKETKKVPKVDDVLDDARKFQDKTRRKQKYDVFQTIIADEVPEAFLYYPEEIYVVNNRVKNIKLTNINSIEQRFINISDWVIEY